MPFGLSSTMAPSGTMAIFQLFSGISVYMLLTKNSSSCFLVWGSSLSCIPMASAQTSFVRSSSVAPGLRLKSRYPTGQGPALLYLSSGHNYRRPLPDKTDPCPGGRTFAPRYWVLLFKIFPIRISVPTLISSTIILQASFCQYPDIFCHIVRQRYNGQNHCDP